DVFKYPWRWDFGDHTRPAYGTRVRHVYRKPDTHRIAVLAYYPIYGAWQCFDDVTIHVRQASSPDLALRRTCATFLAQIRFVADTDIVLQITVHMAAVSHANNGHNFR